MQTPNHQIEIPGQQPIISPPGMVATVIQNKHKLPVDSVQRYKQLIQQVLKALKIDFATFELERKNPQFSIKLRNECEQRIIIMLPPLPKTIAVISMAESRDYKFEQSKQTLKILDFLTYLNRKLLSGVFYFNEKKSQVQYRTAQAFADEQVFKFILRKMIRQHLESFNRSILVVKHCVLEKDIPTDTCCLMING